MGKGSAWRKFQGDFIAALLYLKRAYNKDGDKYFSRAFCDTARGNIFKLNEGRFRLDILYCEGGEPLKQAV